MSNIKYLLMNRRHWLKFKNLFCTLWIVRGCLYRFILLPLCFGRPLTLDIKHESWAYVALYNTDITVEYSCKTLIIHESQIGQIYFIADLDNKEPD